MSDRPFYLLAHFHFAGPGGAHIGGLQRDVFANKLLRLVESESTREQSRFAKNLEAIADAQYQAAPLGVFLYALHDRSQGSHRPTTKVVTVGKATRQDYQLVFAKRRPFLMPNAVGFKAREFGERVNRVIVAIGAGKGYDRCFHSLIS